MGHRVVRQVDQRIQAGRPGILDPADHVFPDTRVAVPGIERVRAAGQVGVGVKKDWKELLAADRPVAQFVDLDVLAVEGLLGGRWIRELKSLTQVEVGHVSNAVRSRALVGTGLHRQARDLLAGRYLEDHGTLFPVAVACAAVPRARKVSAKRAVHGGSRSGRRRTSVHLATSDRTRRCRPGPRPGPQVRGPSHRQGALGRFWYG